jgi:hypothetical protein
MILWNDLKYYPIPFVDQLVIEVLADRKTETRRIVQRIDHSLEVRKSLLIEGAWMYNGAILGCPYGAVGDRLWVRERFLSFRTDGSQSVLSKIDHADFILFMDGNGRFRESEYFKIPKLALAGYRWRPPMHLPFWGHRIDLEVTGISIERLHDIDEAGAIAEGFQNDDSSEDRSNREFDRQVCPQCGGFGIYAANSLGGAVFDADCTMKCDTARGKFRIKWDVINGKREDIGGNKLTWDLNPYVWCVKFKRVKEANGQA